MSKEKFKIYDGPISERTMEEDAFRGYISWRQQRQRCYNPNNNRFQHVGAKGIEVEYSVREFIGWWLHHRKKNPKMKSPTCGRINHDENYRFDNIEMQSRANNTRERNARRGYHNVNVVTVIAKHSSGFCLYFSSVAEASRVSRVPRSLLELHLDGKIPSPVPQLVFKRTKTP